MIELVIAIIAAASLIVCFSALMCGADRCSGCAGAFTKEELLEAMEKLPDNAQVYITIEKR